MTEVSAGTLTDFLLARLSDDADEQQYAPWHRYSCGAVGDMGFSCDCGLPARVLAECEAKLAIVEWCTDVIGARDVSGYGKFGFLADDPDALAVTLAVETLRLLAVPYADHPDFRPEWRP